MSSPRRRPVARTNAPDVPVPRWQTATPAPQLAHLDEIDPSGGRAVRAVHLAGSRSETARRARQGAVHAMIAAGGPRIVYQPQLSLSRMTLSGYEALARFPGSSPGRASRGTQAWFTVAHKIGLGDQLEAIAVQRALEQRDHLPPGTTLAVNLSPAVLTSPFVIGSLPEDLSGIEIELTEHEWVPSNGRLRRELDRLRARGARIAIDDVGVAHSGLRRVMELAPDRVKLDRHLVRGVSASTAKAALIRSVVDFAEQIRCDVCAEGVETLADLQALADLDVGTAQGYAVGTPEADLRDVDPAAVAASRESLRGLLCNPVTASGHLDSAVGVEHLLSRLASVTSLRQLARLIYSYAGVLGADLLVLSMLTPDGGALRSLEGPFGLAVGDPYRLDEYPLTDRAITTRTIAPIYLPADCPGGGPSTSSPTRAAPEDGWLVGGDEAEWGVLRAVEMTSVLLVPVISRDRPIGLLECYGETPNRWSRRQIRSARTVAAMLGPVLDVLISR